MAAMLRGHRDRNYREDQGNPEGLKGSESVRYRPPVRQSRSRRGLLERRSRSQGLLVRRSRNQGLLVRRSRSRGLSARRRVAGSQPPVSSDAWEMHWG